VPVRGIEIPEIRLISAENMAGIPFKFFFQLFRLFFWLLGILIKIYFSSHFANITNSGGNPAEFLRNFLL
jgi:hypothetical protein